MSKECKFNRCCCKCASHLKIHVCTCGNCPTIEGYICTIIHDSDKTYECYYKEYEHGECEMFIPREEEGREE